VFRAVEREDGGFQHTELGAFGQYVLAAVREATEDEAAGGKRVAYRARLR
jgi:hypothetical protein